MPNIDRSSPPKYSKNSFAVMTAKKVTIVEPPKAKDNMPAAETGPVKKISRWGSYNNDKSTSGWGNLPPAVLEITDAKKNLVQSLRLDPLNGMLTLKLLTLVQTWVFQNRGKKM